MSICEITCSDPFKGDGIVSVVHDCLRKVRRTETIGTGEAANDVGGAVRCLPDVTVISIAHEMKLPARGMILEEMRDTAPVDVIGGVRASAFGVNVSLGDDSPEIGVSSHRGCAVDRS